jgi:hypothetical protein
MNGKSIQKHVAILGTQDKCKQSKNTIQKNEQMSNREPIKKPRGLMCSFVFIFQGHVKYQQSYPVSYNKQELLTLREHMSPLGFFQIVFPNPTVMF